MFTNPVLAAAVPVLSRLADCGFEAVFVGGCVRDACLGRPITDVDIATSAKPQEVMKLFPRTAPTGLKHGTVTVIMEDRTYEVTTYRKESEYETYRRPADVDFITDLTEDLQRRDFTMNAMALSMEGKLIDPFGGQRDLLNGVVRCVGEPDARFQEDALRMIRGIRFAAEYGSSECPIEPDTWQAIQRHRELLRHIAMERVGSELDKMMKGAGPDLAMALLKSSGLLACTKEKLPIPDGNSEINSAMVGAVELASITNPSLRWAVWFLKRRFDGNAARKWLETLRFSGQRTAFISSLVSFQLDWLSKSASISGKFSSDELNRLWIGQVIRYGREVTAAWLRMVEQAGGLDMPDPPVGELNDRFDCMPVASLRELAVNGNDIMLALRKKPGPWLQRCLSDLLMETASGNLSNEKESLLRHAHQWAGKEKI